MSPSQSTLPPRTQPNQKGEHEPHEQPGYPESADPFRAHGYLAATREATGFLHHMTRDPLPAQKPPSPVAGNVSSQSLSWSFGHLMRAPHRLAFFLAITLLIVSSTWWWLVQIGRQSWGWSVPMAMSPTVVHAAVMSMGFFPLFFAGFLFTASPKWLGVPPPNTQSLLPSLGLQGTGWLLWLIGAAWSNRLAWTGMLLATAGLLAMYTRFWRMVQRSDADDRLHAKIVSIAGGVGICVLLGAQSALWLGQTDLALLAIRTGLWGFVVTTYVTVAHRMLPFFTSSALPMIAPWGPMWVLWFLLGVASLEALAAWAPLLLDPGAWQGARTPRAWMLALGLIELATGSVVLWLALTWGLVQSLKFRLLAMLHAGFTWLGVALVLSGASQLLGLRQGVPVLGLGALHALTMGFMGSVLLAMVTRVSCGHSGRSLVADNLIWALFGLLQVATVLRIASALEHATTWLTLSAASSWLVIMVLWGSRLSKWYGQPRKDGKPG